MKKLNLSDKLQLPAEEIAESAIGLIAKRGRGKSGVLKVLMEEMSKAGVPFVMFDPVGIAYGLRSSFDGKTASGIQVLVVGGPHADVRLERRAGAAVAQAVVQANVSAIIDFSEEPKSVYREFVRDFALEIFRINDGPRLIILEEAPELVPQRLRPDMTTTFDAVERLVSRGRNKGLGVVLVSQRSATINKDVLTQVDVMIVMGLTSPQDRAALKEWVEAKADKEKLKEFDEGLAGLQRQEGWVWSPEAFGGIFRKVRFRDFTTFHPDKTHLRRQGLLQVKPVTTDVSAIVNKLGAAVAKISKEKTAAGDAKRLEAQLSKANAEIERLKARPAPASSPRVEVKRVQVPTLSTKDLHMLESISKAVKASKEAADIAALQSNRAAAAASALIAKLGKIALAAGGGPATFPRPVGGATSPRPTPRLETPAIREARASMALDRDQTHSEGEVSLRSGERRMLQTLVQRHPIKLTRAQLATLSGFTASGGTFGTYFGVLKRHGLLHENGDDSVTATEAGIAFLGGDVPPAPSTTAELLDMWRRNLRSGEWKMLDCLVKDYPNAISREQLGIATDFEHTGGTFGTYLGVLKRNGLIEVNGDQVKASETLFIDGA